VALVIMYLEIYVGIGRGLGPIIGSVVYKAFEFEKCMYLFGAFNLVSTLIVIFVYPSVLNKKVVPPKTDLSSKEN